MRATTEREASTIVALVSPSSDLLQANLLNLQGSVYAKFKRHLSDKKKKTLGVTMNH